MPRAAEGFARNTDLGWSKAGFCWSIVGLLVNDLLGYPFDTAIC